MDFWSDQERRFWTEAARRTQGRIGGANLRKPPSGTRRQDRRSKSLKRGRIHFNLARSTLDVTILNTSLTGAKLMLASPWPCALLFELEVFSPSSGEVQRRRCEVVWQKGVELGVRYLS